MNYNSSNKSFSKIKKIVISLILNFIDGNKFLFEKFVGFNDCQEGCASVKRAIMMLNNIIKRFYSDKYNQRNKSKYDNEIKSIFAWSYHTI